MRERDLSEAAGASLVIFDCDGVLVDSEVLSMRAYQDILADIGVEAPASLWSRCVGLKQADIFALIEAAAGRSVPQDVRARLWPRTRALFEAELRPTAGLVGFLETFSARRCVASSSDPERIRFSLGVAGLTRFFGDAVFSSQYVAHGKPAPDIFLYAAGKMGVDAADAVVIEDSLPGVQAARAAGARAIGFLGGAHVGADHGERLIAAGAEAVAENWPEVARLLAKGAPIAL